MIRRHAEYTFDAIRISNYDLDVSFRVESCTGIERRAFYEEAAKGIDRLHSPILENLM